MKKSDPPVEAKHKRKRRAQNKRARKARKVNRGT